MSSNHLNLRHLAAKHGYALRKSRRSPDCYSLVHVGNNAMLYLYVDVPLSEIIRFLSG